MKSLLIKEFGKERGSALEARRSAIAAELEGAVSESSPARAAIVRGRVVPNVALYRALQEEGSTAEEALETVRRIFLSMVEKASAYMRAFDSLPFSFALFRSLFAGMRKKGYWDCQVLRDDPGRVRVDIVRCLWHDACKAYGCPELCAMFCDSDDIMYGDLRRIGFARSGTLGKGADRCDFDYFPKS